MTEPIRFGIVGAGAIAQAHAEAILQYEDAQLVGVADTRLDVAEAMAESFHCAAFPSHVALRREAMPDAVIVCVPPALHAEICGYFISEGLPVLCEKPLTIDSATAEELLRMSQDSGVLFTMASKFRFVDDVIRTKSIIQSGILGEILLFENAFTSHVDMTKRWNSNREISGGGVLIDNGTHSVDIIRYLLGPIAQIQAVEGKRAQGLAVEDTVQVFARSATGVICTIDLSWALNKELDSFIHVYGSEGVIQVGWRESRYRQRSSKDWIRFGNGYDKLTSFRNQIENFCTSLRGKTRLRVGPEDALASVRVIEAAYRSLGADNWVSVPER